MKQHSAAPKGPTQPIFDRASSPEETPDLCAAKKKKHTIWVGSSKVTLDLGSGFFKSSFAMRTLKAVKHTEIYRTQIRLAILSQKSLYSLQHFGGLQELVVGLLWGVLDKREMKGDMEPSTIPKSFWKRNRWSNIIFFHIC